MERMQDGTIIDNWKESLPLKCVHLILYHPREVDLKNKTNIYESIIFHRDSYSIECEKNPLSLKLSDEVVNEIHQRNLKQKYYVAL